VTILALNAGSSSLKLALFEREGEAARRRTTVEQVTDQAAALDRALGGLDRPDAVGHRLVHGGPDHEAPARLDPALRRALDALVPFAPLHLPAELAFLDAVEARWPGIPQVVCFDTAFHRTMPEVASRLPLPRDLFDAGVRRYGFHGLSYEFVTEALGPATLGRAILAHLGSGSSMAAVRDGRSIDTTMGFTPTGGLMMGTRTGDLDPGVLVHLMDHRGADARELETLVNQRSGLKGVSGTTSDLKTLLAASPTDPHARLAIEMYCYSARKFIGALTASLGGLDTLVFTGGIGEHAAPVRAQICAGLGYLGIRLDEAKNQAHQGTISAEGGSVRVLVVPTDEERMIARHVGRLLSR
jgi:acetate kinase